MAARPAHEHADQTPDQEAYAEADGFHDRHDRDVPRRPKRASEHSHGLEFGISLPKLDKTALVEHRRGHHEREEHTVAGIHPLDGDEIGAKHEGRDEAGRVAGEIIGAERHDGPPVAHARWPRNTVCVAVPVLKPHPSLEPWGGREGRTVDRTPHFRRSEKNLL